MNHLLNGIRCARCVLARSTPLCDASRAASSGTVASSPNRDRVVFSGIQPTGVLHIGNYFGAVSQWLELQKDPFTKCFISIVDLHAFTEFQYPDELYNGIFDMAAGLLACGIDPNHTVLFQQSAVPYHTELAWLISPFVTLARLERMNHFEAKSSRFKKGAVPPGILMYPVLQAADIMLYRSTHVPIGKDQEVHLELCHHIVRLIQSRYQTDLFPMPRLLLADEPRIRSLRNPELKMSKSDVSAKSRIELCDDPDVMRDKIRKALTDFVSEVFYEPTHRPAVANLMALNRLITGETYDEITMRCVDMSTAQYKAMLAELVISKFQPIHAEYMRLRNERQYIRDILEYGRSRATEVAEDTMRQCKALFGFDIQQDITKYLADERKARLEQRRTLAE